MSFSLRTNTHTHKHALTHSGNARARDLITSLGDRQTGRDRDKDTDRETDRQRAIARDLLLWKPSKTKPSTTTTTKKKRSANVTYV